MSHTQTTTLISQRKEIEFGYILIFGIDHINIRFPFGSCVNCIPKMKLFVQVLVYFLCYYLNNIERNTHYARPSQKGIVSCQIVALTLYVHDRQV